MSPRPGLSVQDVTLPFVPLAFLSVEKDKEKRFLLEFGKMDKQELKIKATQLCCNFSF